MRSFQLALSMLIAVCVLSPAQLEHVLGFTSFRLRFGGVLIKGGDLFREHGLTVFQLGLF